MLSSEHSPRPFIAASCKEMGIDTLEGVTKNIFHEVETLGSLTPELRAAIPLDLLRSLQEMFRKGLAVVDGLINIAASPINRIPPEILAYIFALVPRRRSYDIGEPGYWAFSQAVVQDLHPLPKVCRHWRELALATPTLWGTVSGVDRDGTWSLQRSIYLFDDSSPQLSVHINKIPSVDQLRMKQLVMKNACRIRELHSVSALTTKEIPEFLKSFDARALEKCLLEPADSGPALEHGSRFLPFFSAGGAKLRFLCLRNISALPTNEFPVLSVLTLSWYGQYTPVSWDLWDLLKFVSGCPWLEEVHLSKACFAAATMSRRNPHPVQTPVELPYLRYLSFTYLLNTEGGPRGAVNFLLSHLVVPSACHLYFSVLQAPKDDTNGAILDNVCRHVLGKDRASGVALWLPDELCRWPHRRYLALQLAFPSGSLRLLFPDRDELKSFLSAHSDVFAETEDLRIHYRDSSDFPLSFGTSLHDIFASVKAMSIISEGRSTLDVSPLQRFWNSPSGAAKAIPYPALDTLWVRLQDLGPERARGAAHLEKVLGGRAARGAPVRRAIICYKPPDTSKPWTAAAVSGSYGDEVAVRNIGALEALVNDVVLVKLPSSRYPPGEFDWTVRFPEKYGLPAVVRRDWPVWWKPGQRDEVESQSRVLYAL